VWKAVRALETFAMVVVFVMLMQQLEAWGSLLRVNFAKR
jgi:hypothetical protein